MEKRLTDNEIIKALDDCLTKNKKQIFFISNENKIQGLSIADALDLINRQKAEIEELQLKNSELEIELKAMRGAANSYKAENERLKTNLNVELDNFASEYDDKIKAEAYKEFAERLKEKTKWCISAHFVRIEINNLLKELVGEDK